MRWRPSHAGWRGLAGGVIEATVRALGSAPASILAWLGPAIGPEHFEVGPEVREALLQQRSRRAGSAFEPNARGRYLADLRRSHAGAWSALGIERIYGGGECTFAAADRYFSHRRDGCDRAAGDADLAGAARGPLNCRPESPHKREFQEIGRVVSCEWTS